MAFVLPGDHFALVSASAFLSNDMPLAVTLFAMMCAARAVMTA